MSIEKFKPNFEAGRVKHQSKPYTQVLNKPIQECRNLELIGLWTYFQTLPEDWIIHLVHVQNHFGIGKDKAQRLFAQLIECNLIIKNVVRNANGSFKSIDYIVCNGETYTSINEQKTQVCAPLPEKPVPAEPAPVNPPHTNKTITTNKNNPYKENISCASGDAHDRFDEFWSIYPLKKNKQRAKRIWKRKRFDEIATLICEDVRNRTLNESQWQDKQYIPHPSRYLSDELWLDEITPVKAATTKTSKIEENFSRAFRTAISTLN